MKKLILIAVLLMTLLSYFDSKAILIISTKSRYGGGDSCIDAKGLCIILKGAGDKKIVQSGRMIGEISNNPSTGLTLIIDRTYGISNSDFDAYFKAGYFYIDGEITFQPKVLSKVGYSGNTIFQIKKYKYIINDDKIYIYLN